MLNETPRHEGVWGPGNVTPHILNVNTKLKSALPAETISPYSLALRGGHVSGEGYKYLCVSDIQRALCLAGSSQAAIPTDCPSLTGGRKEI